MEHIRSLYGGGNNTIDKSVGMFAGGHARGGPRPTGSVEGQPDGPAAAAWGPDATDAPGSRRGEGPVCC